jgi:hypothetical protein
MKGKGMRRFLDLADELLGFIGGGLLFLLGVAGGCVLLLLVWVLETIGFLFVGLYFVYTKIKMWIRGE